MTFEMLSFLMLDENLLIFKFSITIPFEKLSSILRKFIGKIDLIIELLKTFYFLFWQLWKKFKYGAQNLKITHKFCRTKSKLILNLSLREETPRQHCSFYYIIVSSSSTTHTYNTIRWWNSCALSRTHTHRDAQGNRVSISLREHSVILQIFPDSTLPLLLCVQITVDIDFSYTRKLLR